MDAYQNKDYTTALKEWKPFADQGIADAHYNLGLMYDNGQGVIQNYARAHMWWNIAASQGNKNALDNRDKVAKDRTASQIEKVQTLTFLF